MDYKKALHKLLDSQSITSYLEQEELLSISVSGKNEQKCEEMLTDIEFRGGRSGTCRRALRREIPRFFGITGSLSGYDDRGRKRDDDAGNRGAFNTCPKRGYGYQKA